MTYPTTDYDKGYFDAANDQVSPIESANDQYIDGVEAWLQEAEEMGYDFGEDYEPPLVGAPDY